MCLKKNSKKEGTEKKTVYTEQLVGISEKKICFVIRCYCRI